MMNFNERTNTHLYKNIISHNLFLIGWCFCCVWEMSWRRNRPLYWPQVLLTITALLPHLGWGCSTVGHWGPKALCLLLALNSASLQLTRFLKYSNSQPIASRHDVIHTPVQFPIWGLLWQFWLSYPLRASVNCAQWLCTWTKSQIVQRPTKPNDKI